MTLNQTLAIKTRSNTTIISLIILLMVTSFVTTDIYLPSLPDIAHVWHVNIGQVQMTLSIYLISFGLSQLIFGILSDQFGRRNILIAGLIISLVGSIVVMASYNIHELLIGRFIQGIGVGSAALVSRVLIRDCFNSQTLAKVMSYIAMIVVVTPAIAPVLGGYIQNYFGFEGNFIFIFAFIFTVTMLVFFLLPETQAKHHREKIGINQLKKHFKSIIANFDFWKNMLSNGLAFAVVIAYSSVNPFLFENKLHYSAVQFGYVTLMIAAGMVLGFFINTKLSGKVVRENLIRYSQYLILLGGLVFFIPSLFHTVNTALIASGLFLAVIGVAVLLPNAAANIFAKNQHIAGKVAATYGSLQVIISGMVGFVISSLHMQSALALGLTVCIIGLTGLLVSK